ncbi:MAG: helix-turn-helix domain-containing protein [Lachnospiraceae bacterium]|nr:helix-turn-helix domain-containing protein [Lachnospiraceae bacterium]
MKKRRGFENYDYLSTDVIKLACSGDKEALGKVIARYDNYAIKCTKSMAVSKFGLDVETIPIDDIMQTIWMRMIELILTRFKFYDN